MRRPAVFLDRDGTIIEDVDYLATPGGVRLLPGAADAIARLASANLPVVIITNQSGIGRGFYSEDDYVAVRRRLNDLLMAAGGRVLATYHCPHSPERIPPCDCRKPAPGLFLQASRDHDLDLARSFYVGDRMRDIEAGIALGGTGYLISAFAPGEMAPVESGVQRAVSLSDAVDRLLVADKGAV